jgi:hypothetical protein
LYGVRFLNLVIVFGCERDRFISIHRGDLPIGDGLFIFLFCLILSLLVLCGWFTDELACCLSEGDFNSTDCTTLFNISFMISPTMSLFFLNSDGLLILSCSKTTFGLYFKI